MSRSANRHEAFRWLRTAEADLHAARILSAADSFALACFHAQQAGEKALKALWHLEDADPWGHSVRKLLTEFPRITDLEACEPLKADASLLDQYYIPTRYPNGLPDLTPGEVYTEADAARAMAASERILRSCRNLLDQES